MGRRARIPNALKKAPFTLAEARAVGLTPECLKGRSWRRLGSGLYCWRGWLDDHALLIAAWQRRLPPDAVFAGATAAWLWGIGPVSNPVEIILPPTAGVRTRRDLYVRRCLLHEDDVGRARGFRVTTVARTLRDFCARMPPVEALVVFDVALRAGLGDAFKHLSASRHSELAALAAPAESPMETRLRWLLLEAGLPRPEVQTDLRDSDGRFVGRADLFYRESRLVIEYDGTNHRERLVEDNRRQNLLINAGFRLLRFTAADLARQDAVASAVRRALRETPE